MTAWELFLCTAGMALGTIIPRALPMTLLGDRPMPPLVRRWLTFVPVSILAAMVTPDIFLQNGQLNLSTNNIFLLAALPTIVVAWKSRSLFGTLAVGMALVALGRYLGLGA